MKSSPFVVCPREPALSLPKGHIRFVARDPWFVARATGHGARITGQ